jgi:hypothetical protein
VDWVLALVFLSVSFWGWFGWLKVSLGKTTMEILRRVTLLLIIGGGAAWVRAWLARKSEAGHTFRLGALLLLGLGLLLNGLILTTQFLIGPPAYIPTGRYVFPYISAFAILAVWGWQAWWPRPWKAHGILIGLGLLAVVDFVAVVLTIVPYFYS